MIIGPLICVAGCSCSEPTACRSWKTGSKTAGISNAGRPSNTKQTGCHRSKQMDRQIKTIEQLARAADARKAVYSAVWCFRSPRPASFILHMQGSTIVKLLRAGMWIYDKKGAKHEY